MNETQYSLTQINNLVKRTIKESFPSRYWVHAELSEVREHSSGHCYIEFIEKDEKTGNLLAKARGTIWSSVYRMVKPYFETKTGHVFTSGIKVLVEVSLEFHELYGYSLTVYDIDPAYTMGDMALRLMEIMRRLTDEGVVNMNKELDWEITPQRVAVISSSSAAGYGDFVDQLHNNPYGYIFYVKLFPAAMQGSQSEESVIAALDAIYNRSDLFDSVVIIRGGGATSDLTCFDSYKLALHITQFPLPVITGIGHERDDTVIDMVANRKVKTPTAAAEFLIAKVGEADSRRIQAARAIDKLITDKLYYENRKWIQMSQNIPLMAEKMVLVHRNKLQRNQELIGQFLKFRLEKEQQRLQLIHNTVELSSPYTILKKGYSITTLNGKTIRSVSEIDCKEKIVTQLADGEIESEIINIKK